jgi:hypothetical protein
LSFNVQNVACRFSDRFGWIHRFLLG